MLVEVAEVSRHETGGIYALINFWWDKANADAGAESDHSNDFIMQIRRQYQVNIGTDEAPVYETRNKTNAELRQEVRQNVINYWRLYKQSLLSDRPWPRKHDQREKMRLNQDDSDGVLARVRAMQGTREEVAGE